RLTDSAPPHHYPLSLHDALPISRPPQPGPGPHLDPESIPRDGGHLQPAPQITIGGQSPRAPGAGGGSELTRPDSWEWLRLIRIRSEEHTSELQSQSNLVCRLLLE